MIQLQLRRELRAVVPLELPPRPRACSPPPNSTAGGARVRSSAVSSDRNRRRPATASRMTAASSRVARSMWIVSIKPEAAGCWTGGCSCGCRVRGVVLSCGSIDFFELRERSDRCREKRWARPVGGGGEARRRRHAGAAARARKVFAQFLIKKSRVTLP